MNYKLYTMLLLFAIAALFAQPVLATGNVGVNYSRAVNDTSWGALGEFEHRLVENEVGNIDIGVEGDIQSGDAYTGNLDAWIQFGVLKLTSHNIIKGYALDTLGRENHLNLSGVIPFGDAVEVRVGASGRNGNPFEPRNALGTLVDTGFTESDFEGLGLDQITLAEGISLPDGSALLASLEAQFEISRFKVDAQGLLELLGTGRRTHQIKSSVSTDGELFGGLDWQAVVNFYAQFYQNEDGADVVELENNWTLSTIYKF